MALLNQPESLNWETEFPGTTAAIIALRDSLIAADLDHLQSRAAFHQLNSITHNTHIPMHEWEPKLLKHFTYLKRQAQIDNRHFTLALQALQAASASYQTAQIKIAQTPVLLPPEPKPPVIEYYEQIIDIAIVDGVITTTVDYSAADFIKLNYWDHLGAVFFRRFYFAEPIVVPEPYQYVLTHDGVTYEPHPRTVITYSREEFRRLCYLEVETNSPYLLDGVRRTYRRPD